MTDGYWYHGNGKIGGEFHPTKPNDEERYGEYVKICEVAKMNSLDYQLGFTQGYAKAKEESEPTKHGRWEVGYEPYGVVVHRCSLCGHTIATHENSNYCPNCGAKMDEVEK